MTTKTVTRTVLGAYLQTNNLLGKKIQMLPHSTLNEKFGILDPTVNPVNDITLGDLNNPSLKCLVVGNGGHRMSTGPSPDNIPFASPIQHRCTDFALFRHIPFALRDIAGGEDVTGGTFIKANYCLRKEITYDGVNYAAYYGRRILSPEAISVVTKHFVTENGEITTDENFTPTFSDNLEPEPPAIPNTGVIETSADYLAVSAILPLLLSPDEIEELKNVANVIYGNEDLAIISEIGVCTGIDMVVPGSVPPFTDVKCCQIFTHVVTYHAASQVNNGLEINLELGATEPLLALTEN